MKGPAMKHIKTVTIAASLALAAITPAIVHSEDFDPDAWLKEHPGKEVTDPDLLRKLNAGEKAAADPLAERQFARCAIKIDKETGVSAESLIAAHPDAKYSPVLQIKMYDCMHDAGYDVTSEECSAYQPRFAPLAGPQCYSRGKP